MECDKLTLVFGGKPCAVARLLQTLLNVHGLFHFDKFKLCQLRRKVMESQTNYKEYVRMLNVELGQVPSMAVQE